MPTESFDAILNRDETIEMAKPVIEKISPVLKEAVNYATHLYERCNNTQKADNEESFAVFALYLHILHMIDSIEVLLSNSCTEPAQLQLRSAFEARLGLEYMVEKMPRTRALAWIVRNALDEIESGKQYVKTSPKGEEFAQTMEKEGLNQFKQLLPQLPSFPEEILGNLEQALQKPKYSEIYEEFKELGKKRKKRVEWYSVYGGPGNVRDLAEYLNQKSLYDVLYRKWSKIGHAVISDHLTLSLEDGKRILGPMRSPMNIVHVANQALGIILEAIQLMIKQYLSGDTKKFSRWYREEIQQTHIDLCEMEMGHLEWYRKKFIDKKENSDGIGT